MRPAVRANDAELVEQDADRLRGHFRAAIGVHDRLTRSDVLALEHLRDEVLGDGGVGTAHEHPADEASGARELHPRALSEPYVSLSTHTAPVI